MRYRVISHDWLPFLEEKLQILMVINGIGWVEVFLGDNLKLFRVI